MGRAKSPKDNNSFITLNPYLFFRLLSVTPFSSLLFSASKKNSRNQHHHHHNCSSSPNLSLSLSAFIFFIFAGISAFIVVTISLASGPCSAISLSPLASFSFPTQELVSISAIVSGDESRIPGSVMVPLPSHPVAENLSEAEREFWKQPDGQGYRPCLEFSLDYRKASAKITKEKKRFLVVVVSGGLNQQRNQIVDAVVIARILEAALVVPVLQVNRIWGDESEFSDIFDVEHFKMTLQADVRVVSSLPSTHLVSRQSITNQIPLHVPPLWFRARFFKQLNEEGLIVLKGLDSKLSKNLPLDLQKLRCKVAFHALRFAVPIQEVGNRIARRMWIEGPYIAIHMRLEKDVWLRTGCLTGLGNEYDSIIARDRESHPEYLTGRLNMSHFERRLAGMCPLNALEVARFLKALGARNTARIYVAGGEPFGGGQALQALAREFPRLVTKEMLAHVGELEPYVNSSSILAAIDYIVSLSSDVFVPSHGGNMGRALQGHRAYVGHKKFMKPNKRLMVPLLEETSISDSEFRRIMRNVHRNSVGQPELRTRRIDRDVVAYPVPECMCKH